MEEKMKTLKQDICNIHKVPKSRTRKHEKATTQNHIKPPQNNTPKKQISRISTNIFLFS